MRFFPTLNANRTVIQIRRNNIRSTISYRSICTICPWTSSLILDPPFSDPLAPFKYRRAWKLKHTISPIAREHMQKHISNLHRRVARDSTVDDETLIEVGYSGVLIAGRMALLTAFSTPFSLGSSSRYSSEGRVISAARRYATVFYLSICSSCLYIWVFYLMLILWLFSFNFVSAILILEVYISL